MTQGTSDWKDSFDKEFVTYFIETKSEKETHLVDKTVEDLKAFIERVRVEAVAEKVGEIRKEILNLQSIRRDLDGKLIEVLALPSLSGRPDQE